MAVTKLEMPTGAVPTLEDGIGFVALVDRMLSDPALKVVNAARISYQKSKSEFGEADRKLAGFLWEHGHTSPYRHSYFTFHWKAPLFVFRLGYDALWPALALGVVGLTSHYCLAKAFLSGDATTVVPLDFLRIPLIALVGWMLYGETVDLYVLAGAALIIGGILWNLLAESRQSPHTLSTRIQKPQVRA